MSPPVGEHIRPRPRSRQMPTGWSDVPMPPGVAALPRTRSGIPVSYTVAYSSEGVPEAREDPLLRGLIPAGTLALAHSGRRGDGDPILGQSDVTRTRRATITGLCQVCGQKLPGRATAPWRQHPRFICDLRNQPGQAIRIGHRTVPLLVDGWTCAPCLTYGLQVCPQLVTRLTPRGDDLVILRVHDAQLVATYEHNEGLPDIPALVGWVKVAPTTFDQLTPQQFLSTINQEA